jgi:hypothetical protein
MNAGKQKRFRHVFFSFFHVAQMGFNRASINLLCIDGSDKYGKLRANRGLLTNSHTAKPGNVVETQLRATKMCILIPGDNIV